jgi:predicted CXXCH cytochrome family protein
VDLENGTQSVVGEEGEALGQFQYPFKLAMGKDGDLFVVDVINSRVQVLTAEGRPTGSIGAYGAEIGQLYRPTAVATDRQGNVWIADAVLGVIQVFTPLGRLRDVLRDESGAPFKFEMPMDLAFDAQGDLYVVELLADRVRKFAVTFDPRAPTPSAAARPRTAVGGTEGRSCTVCHLEWLEPFNRGDGTALLNAPSSSTDQPAVSRATVCLSCHNGVVVDSRRRVWEEHGHATDALPPPGMTVPPMLPLVNGRVVCRTCHTAHTGGVLTGGIKTSVFLRVAGQAGELCVLCHPDKTRGAELGTHPTGGMPWPVPQAILDSGGRIGPNPRELTCRVCHTPHGAAHDHLLVLGTESNQLCLTCHQELRPGMFREGAAEHPLSPITNPAQAAAVKELGTKLGPEGRLICLSCHKLHHGKGKRFMLAEELHDGSFCLRCHEERRVLLGSPHDLRAAFPEEKNRLGMTPETGGPCSACHLFHRYARAPEASELDSGGGKCVTCHQPGRVAQAKVLPPLNHPKAHCTDCHNPHRLGTGKFLPDHPAEACARCHEAQARLTGGIHDIRRGSAAWPAVSTAAKDPCLACHRPHGTEETGLFRAGRAPGVRGPDAGCLVCHGQASPSANSDVALVHPQDASKLKETPALPMGGADGGAVQIACRTCHDPHGGAGASAELLRSAANGAQRPVCTICHIETAHIQTIGHGSESLRSAGFEADACRPCHLVHARRGAVETRYLWPGLSLPLASEEPMGSAMADPHCLACHGPGGKAPPPAIFSHPKAEMFNAAEADAAGFLPLFNERGEVDPKGRISCRTCHLTHGRPTPAPVPRGGEAIGPRELRARQWHLRTFGAGSVCATCHGFDALRRFMYFHDAARRGGPLEGSRPGPQ